MASIEYTDKEGTHKGTLSIGEYVHYGIDARFPIDYPTGMVWDNTEYVIFKRAVSKKYNTEVLEAKLV